MNTGSENGCTERPKIQVCRCRPEEYASLIIRLWRLPRNQAADVEPDWRSEVEHIQSGGHWAFPTSEELEHFLSDFLRR
ncbi:MAG: hypothetical protein JXA78_11085 [Anaerolineales bacterium]|nr:hypothetical protein [Anaerolineales bacterium]